MSGVFGSAAGIRAGQAFVEVGADTSQLQKQIVDGVTKALNTNAGGLGTNLSLLRQFSEIRIFDRALNGVRQLSDATVKLKGELDAGEISAGAMADKIIATVPWIGQWWQIGRDIHELFTGDNEELSRTLDYVQSLNTLMAMTRDVMKEGNKDVQDINDSLERTIASLNKIAQPGALRPEAAAQAVYDEGIKAANKKADADKKDILKQHMVSAFANNLTGDIRLAGKGAKPADPTSETTVSLTPEQARKKLQRQLDALRASGNDVVGSAGWKRSQVERGFQDRVDNLQNQVNALAQTQNQIANQSSDIDAALKQKTSETKKALDSAMGRIKGNEQYGLDKAERQRLHDAAMKVMPDGAAKDVAEAKFTYNERMTDIDRKHTTGEYDDQQRDQEEKTAQREFFFGLGKAGEDWVKSNVEATQKWMKGVEETIKKNNEAQKEQREKFSRLNRAESDLHESLETPMEKLASLQKELRDAFSAGLVNAQDFHRGMDVVVASAEGPTYTKSALSSFDIHNLDPGGKDLKQSVDGISRQLQALIGMAVGGGGITFQ